METELKPIIVSVHGYSLLSDKHHGDETSMQDDSLSVNDGEPVPKKPKTHTHCEGGPSQKNW